MQKVVGSNPSAALKTPATAGVPTLDEPVHGAPPLVPAGVGPHILCAVDTTVLDHKGR
jgi:hypothetical protein